MKWAAILLAAGVLISGTVIGLRATDNSGPNSRPSGEYKPATLPDDFGQP